MTTPIRVNGRFAPGSSGNVKGRPPKSTALIRQDSVPAAPVRRQDSYQNKFTGHGTARDRRVFTRYGTEIVTDQEALDLWETEFLAARIIEAEPEEAYRRGWTFKHKDEEFAEEIWNWADELGVEGAMVDAREKERALGGSAIFPVLDGALGDLGEPLDWNSISDVKALHVLEPRELQAIAFYESLDERGWSMPSMYMFQPLTSGFGNTFGSQPIHASRLIVFPGLRVSRQIRPGQRLGWGTSVLTRPKQVLADFGLAWASAATLLHEHGCGVLAMDEYAELMATAEGEEIVARRLATMLMSKSSLRALVIDSKDKYDKQASSLGGASELLNEFKVLMSAASDGMPVSVLMGQAPGGLRTGDDDTRTWYGNVERRRAKKLRPRHAHVMKFLLNSGSGPTGGKEPDHWSVEYPSLWSPSDAETATTRKTDMDRAVAAVGAGIASADDVAESFYGSDQYSGDIHINWNRRKAQAAAAQVGVDDIGPDDMAAMGAGEQGDLTDEEQQQLEALQSEFGTEDGEPEPAEPEDDEEDDFGTEDEPDYADDDEEGRSDDMGAHGYNPYRAKDGKFGAGAHKVKPTADERYAAALGKATERVGKAKAAVDKHAAKLAATHEAKHAALAETRSALSKAQAAGELAKAKPTAKNIKAAQVATNKATRASAKVDKHEAAIGKHTEAHAKSSAAHAKATEAHAKVEAKAPKEKAPAAKAGAPKTETAKPAPQTKVESKPAAAAVSAPPSAAKEPGGLAQTKIEYMEKLGGEDSGLNASYVATLSDGGKAVFKPASGEQAIGISEPVRSNIDAGTYHKREVAAYKLAEHLGMKDMVPETASISHNGEVGSLQRWHSGGKLLALQGDPNGRLEGGARFDHESSERMRVFDYVTGNSDRHAGNLLSDNSSGSPRPILIDHGLTFPKGPPDRFIQPTDAIHESRDLHPNTEKMIRDLDINGIAKTLHASGIEPEAIRHTLIRVKALQSDPNFIATPWSNPAHDAWNMFATDASRMVSRSDLKEIDNVVASSR